jgi:phosphatidylinositol alpha-1,6-mannosyltransferase
MSGAPSSRGSAMSSTEAVANAVMVEDNHDASQPAIGTTRAGARVLVISGNFPPIHGGSAVVYDNLCRYSEGRAVALTCSRNYMTGEEIAGWAAADAKAGYRIYRVALLRPLDHRRPGRLRAMFRAVYVDLPLMMRVFMHVRRVTREEKIDVVCIGDLVYGGWLALALKRLLRSRIVIYVHGEEITTRSSGSLFDRLRRYFLSKADAVVAVSRYTKRELVSIMGVDAARITLIPNGVDHARFFRSEAMSMRQRLGLENCRVILSVGRLVERKGFDRVIDAMATVVAKHPDARCLIAGTGPLLRALEMLVQEWRLERNVRFLGAVSDDELRELYSLADVFVLPNRQMSDGDTEGFGLVFLEANACGTPVVSGVAGGAIDAVQDGVNGLNVDGRDTTQIAEAILRLLEDRDLHDKLRAGALEAAAGASWKARTDLFLDLCDRLVGDTPPVPRSEISNV